MVNFWSLYELECKVNKKKYDSFFLFVLGLFVRSLMLDDYGLRIINLVYFLLECDVIFSGKGGKSCMSGFSLFFDWLKI